MNGVPAIAFSETHVGCREVTDMFLYEIARELIQRPLAGEIWNVNFPDCTLNEYRGILRDVKIEPHCFFENFYNTAENTTSGFTGRSDFMAVFTQSAGVPLIT